MACDLFVGLFIYRGLTLAKLLHAFKFTAMVIGTVLFILGSTKAFSRWVTIFDIPSEILALFQWLAAYPWLIMLFIGKFHILVGMWLESIPQIIIFTAVFFPPVTSLGVNLFVAARLSRITIEDISVGVLPLLLPYMLMILLLVLFSG